MHLSRVVLKRESQEMVLQGMIHVGPDKLYEKLQRDVDWATKDNYQIFFEGVEKSPSKRTLTNSESKIKKFFMLLFDLYPFFAEGLGVSIQKEGVTYPKDAINADITFTEFIKQLDKNGFRCNFMLWLLTRLPKRKLKKSIKENLAKYDSLNDLMDKSEKWSLSKLIVWFLFRKATPIILDYRNKLAVAKIKANSNGRNVFMHYGEKHIKGLVGLLRKEGWVIVKTTHTDLAEF